VKILLIGKAGQLGSDIWRNNVYYDIYTPDWKVMDICSWDAIDAVIDETQPDVVINTAAFHNVPLCETNPELAFRENCVPVRV
jgi:dTDP-4-dehydrorhamnose reductase